VQGGAGSASPVRGRPRVGTPSAPVRCGPARVRRRVHSPAHGGCRRPRPAHANCGGGRGRRCEPTHPVSVRPAMDGTLGVWRPSRGPVATWTL